MSTSLGSGTTALDKGKGRAVADGVEQRRGGSNPLSMKATLEAWRNASDKSPAGTVKHGLPRVPEAELLRDTVFVLQGIDGKHVSFQDSEAIRAAAIKKNRSIHPLDRQDIDDAEDGEGGLLVLQEENGCIVPPSTRALLHRISELGWLYRKIQRGISKKFSNPNAGAVELSLCHCLQQELREYDQLVADLETRRALHTDREGLPADEDSGQGSSKDLSLDLDDKTLGLTLNRIVVWTEEYRLRMRMMGVLVEGCTATRGGALLSLLHSYTVHGDPFIRSFTSTLLEKVSAPFFKSLASWIYEGELVDPSSEFFVERNSSTGTAMADGEEGNTSGNANGNDDSQTWSGRYRFRKAMLPSFVSEDLGRKIFSTGRSLNYIKYACSDGTWVSTQHKLQQIKFRNDKSANKLQYGDIAGLEQSIDQAYSNASKRLFEIFFDKFRLLSHLRAFKDYLLLGRGDFVELLMESLGPSLSRPANTLYRHNLTATLETAIRGSSSATDDPDTLRRLDARMLEFAHGEIGWDVFTLEYKVDPPVDVVLDERSTQIYTKLFKHLWRIKRVEYALNESWRRVMNGSRWFNKVKDLQPDFHQSRIALSEMLHFVKQLSYFCHLEVIDCSWTVLEEFINRKEGDLDALIEAHRAYTDRLVCKALLRGTGSKQDDTILRQVREAFKVMLQFKDTLDALCNYALAEASRIDSQMDEARGITSARSSTPLPPMPPADPEALASIRRRLERYSVQFQDLVLQIVTGLASHSDLDLRFLSCRINFSLYYLVEKRDSKKGSSS